MTTEIAYRLSRSQVWTGDRKTDARLVIETLQVVDNGAGNDAELASVARALLADYAERYPE
jgi:hypothetical protein